jgi:exopolyphosphatase/pppGpp-phosphohydrolase
MTTLHIDLGRQRCVFRDDESGASYVVPVGTDTLAAMVVGNPPLPEELTNAICLFMDHIEDVTREVPSSTFADLIEVCGPGLQALVDTEVGHPKGLPFDVSRDAGEEVFRTLATETEQDRSHNPGLPADEVHHILGVCCALVATFRGLQASELSITGDAVNE